MIFTLRLRSLALVVAGCALAAGGGGCALRATTDFGPQSSSSTHSLSAGPKGFPGGLSGTSGPEGDSIDLRASHDAAGDSPETGPGGVR